MYFTSFQSTLLKYVIARSMLIQSMIIKDSSVEYLLLFNVQASPRLAETNLDKTSATWWTLMVVVIRCCCQTINDPPSVVATQTANNQSVCYRRIGGVKLYQALIALSLCGTLYGYVIYQAIYELQNWNDASCGEISRSPFARWYVVVSIPGLIMILLGACLVGWQLPNRGKAMTGVALLVDLVLGGMLAWGIALYSSRGWCDFWLFDVLLVTWGGSIPVLFFFTYVWGRLREIRLTRTTRKRRLRRANRQLAGANKADGTAGDNDMSVNGIMTSDDNGGVSGRATSSVISIGSGSNGNTGLSPSVHHHSRRLINAANGNGTSSLNNNNNGNGNNGGNDDASARSGLDQSPSASGRSGRPPDSISTDRRRHPHQPYMAGMANNNNSPASAGVRWADTSDISGRSTTAAPLPSGNGTPINNSNNGGNGNGSNNGNGGMIGISLQSGNDGTGSGRSRVARHMHTRLASDNLEVPAILPASTNGRSLPQRQSASAGAEGAGTGNNSPGR